MRCACLAAKPFSLKYASSASESKMGCGDSTRFLFLDAAAPWFSTTELSVIGESQALVRLWCWTCWSCSGAAAVTFVVLATGNKTSVRDPIR